MNMKTRLPEMEEENVALDLYNMQNDSAGIIRRSQRSECVALHRLRLRRSRRHGEKGAHTFPTRQRTTNTPIGL